MITYVVKPGDMIGVLAVKFKTTIRILMNDNPFIPVTQKLEPGWKLNVYSPEENAKRYTDTAYERIESAHRIKEALVTSEHMLSTPRTPVYYKERLVLEGQVGFIKTLQETPLIEAQANGYLKTVTTLPAGEILGVYEVCILKDELMYLVDGYRWVTTNPETVRYEEIPKYNLDGKIKPENIFTTSAVEVKNNQSLVSPSNSTFVGSGAAPTFEKANDGLASIPLFETPNYKRPVMNLKNAIGETKTIELRLTGFTASYSNTVQPATTNGGWMINVRAHGLPVLNIGGILLETKANDEFADFMQVYHKYMAAQKSGDYYALGVSTLFYKQTEYRGIVIAFSYSDAPEQALHRKYNIQMLVLKEKNLSATEIAAIKTVVDRRGQDEKTFRSDIGSMLANPITGKYYTDFYE